MVLAHDLGWDGCDQPAYRVEFLIQEAEGSTELPGKEMTPELLSVRGDHGLQGRARRNVSMATVQSWCYVKGQNS